MPTVIGVDLSLTATGMSDGRTTWLVKSTGHKGDTLATRRERLDLLTAAIAAHIQHHQADLVVLEGPSLGQTRQGGQHDRAGLWWLIVDWCFEYGIPAAEVPPASLKRYATGKGDANKGAIIEATTRRYPHVATGGDDNRCDALWLHAMGLDHLTGTSTVPAAHRTGLAVVQWPTHLQQAS
jgi:crossover junction endodeoxyribonuclease RuvC